MQLYTLPLAAHETQTLNTYITKPVPLNGHPYATQLKQLTQTQTNTLHDLNAHSVPPKNIKATIFHNNEHPTSSSQKQT